MTTAQIDEYYNDYSRSDRENRVDHLYLDSEGHVTIGVGGLLETVQNAQNLIFYTRPTTDHPSRKASKDEIAKEYNKIKSLGKSNRVANSYRKDTTLYVKEDVIRTLFEKGILDKVNLMKSYFPEFDTFPKPGQDALLDMAFNLGVSRLAHIFTDLKLAVNSHDWLLAAEASFRYQVGCKTTRNEDTWRNFRKASELDPRQPKHDQADEVLKNPNFGCQVRLNNALAKIQAKKANKAQATANTPYKPIESALNKPHLKVSKHY